MFFIINGRINVCGIWAMAVRDVQFYNLRSNCVFNEM